MTTERRIGPPAPLDVQNPNMTRSDLIDQLALARRTVLDLSGIEGDQINMENELRKRTASQRYAEGIDLAQKRRFNIPDIVRDVEKKLFPDPAVGESD